MISSTLRIPLQQYAYLEVEWDETSELIDVHNHIANVIEAGIHEDVIALEKAAVVATSMGAGNTQVESHTQASNSWPGEQTGGNTCRHGARKLKEGTSKAGKPYKGWMCPSADRNDQCAAVWS